MFLKIKNKKFFATAISLSLLFILLIPVLTHAGLVPCGNDPKVDRATGEIINGCTFADFITLINNIINWIISIAGVIFTLMAVYGGFLYMTSGTSIGDKEKAKKILWNTILGFVIILISWLIVFTLLNMLVPKGEKSNFIFEFLGGIRR